MIYNSDKITRNLEKAAYRLNSKETELLNSYYYSDFNWQLCDMNIFCYEYKLKEIIKSVKKICQQKIKKGVNYENI